MVPYPNDLFQQFFHGLPQHFLSHRIPQISNFFGGLKHTPIAHKNQVQPILRPQPRVWRGASTRRRENLPKIRGLSIAMLKGISRSYSLRWAYQFPYLFNHLNITLLTLMPSKWLRITYGPRTGLSIGLTHVPSCWVGAMAVPPKILNHSGGCMSSSTRGMRFTMLTEIIWKMFCRWQSMAMRGAPSRKLTTLWLVLNLYLGLLKIPVSMLVAHANLFWHQDRIFLATGRSRKSRMMSLHNMPENNLQILKVTRIFLVGSSLG